MCLKQANREHRIIKLNLINLKEGKKGEKKNIDYVR